jgi:Secretion system C-terminal sorting domain
MGWNYYRLKVIDKTGNFFYSDIRPVKFEKGREDIKIFPNPVTDVLHIQLPTSYINKVQLQVFGVDGKFIALRKPSVNMVDLNVQSLAAATYFLIITKEDGSKETFRFVKQ